MERQDRVKQKLLYISVCKSQQSGQQTGLSSKPSSTHSLLTIYRCNRHSVVTLQWIKVLKCSRYGQFCINTVTGVCSLHKIKAQLRWLIFKPSFGGLKLCCDVSHITLICWKMWQGEVKNDYKNRSIALILGFMNLPLSTNVKSAAQKWNTVNVRNL